MRDVWMMKHGYCVGLVGALWVKGRRQASEVCSVWGCASYKREKEI